MTPDEARNLLVAVHKWTPQTIEVWINAHGRCEYCDADLLKTEATFFHGAHVDHITPKAGDDPNNLALACVACNRIKRATDFSEGDHTFPRSELVERARKHIVRVRERDADRRRTQLELLAVCGLQMD